MKYYSEKLNKLFENEKSLIAAEKDFDKELTAKEISKKELSQKIEVAEALVDKAYAEFEKAKEEATKILDESNKQVTELLDSAKKKITEAEKTRADALVAFNKQFGTYKVNYTGERAERESKRISRLIDDVFSSSLYWPFV